MPCESCNTQFTVFRRKYNCVSCKRNFCNQCLTKKNDRVFCERCALFTKRPISKEELLNMKTKDLIYFLQAKQISTSGCFEKEELADLILTKTDVSIRPFAFETQNEQFIPLGNDSSSDNNAFDQLRQTCHNFFASFTDSLGFDTRATSSTSMSCGQNVTDTRYVRTREIPTYSESINRPTNANANNEAKSNENFVPNISENNKNHLNPDDSNIINISSSPSTSSSSIISLRSTPSIEINQPKNRTEESSSQDTPNETKDEDDDDDEDMVDVERIGDKKRKVFWKRRFFTKKEGAAGKSKPSSTSQIRSVFERQVNDTSDESLKKNQTKSPNNSSSSSFEDVGAVGGPNDNENWQVISICTSSATANNAPGPSRMDCDDNTFRQNFNKCDISLNNDSRNKAQAIRRVLRRRSGFTIAEPSTSNSYENTEEQDDNYQQEQQSRKRMKKCCEKCEISKMSIKEQIDKFRSQLESTSLSPAEVKRELKEFVDYLQQKTNSLDSEPSSNENASEETGQNDNNEDNKEPTASSDYNLTDINDGIHVYGNDEEAGSSSKVAEQENVMQNRRFINLLDIKSISELEKLSVKQMKEILVLNRVDYKGCCEKRELFDRVKRLWDDLQKYPDIENLSSHEICKICMDAPVECVFLECGHVVACTNCGKVLTECPICRQYIARLARFFYA